MRCWLFAASLVLLAGAGCSPPSSSVLSNGPDSPVTRPTAVAAPVGALPAAPPPTTAVPIAVTESVEYDFGFLQTGGIGSHTFAIRNAGTADLKLTEGPTSCACTLSEVENGVVRPGGTGFVHLEYQPSDKSGPFLNTATVRTNDPQRPEITFVVSGLISAFLHNSPESLSFANIGRGEVRSIETVVYSQVLEEMSITSAEATLAGLQTEITPADPQRLQDLNAKSGQTIRVTLPPDLPKGLFQSTLQLKIVGKQNGVQVEHDHSIPVNGKVRYGLTISGPKWFYDRIELGPVSQAQGRKTPLILKAYGTDTIGVEEIRVTPEWVKVTTEPVLVSGRPVGLLRVTIEIPADAPLENFTGPRAGKLHIKLQDGLPEVVGDLDFAVIAD